MAPRRTDLADLSALQARDEIARGAVKAVELAEACLARIAEREPEVQAWAHLDPRLRHAAGGGGRPLSRHRPPDRAAARRAGRRSRTSSTRAICRPRTARVFDAGPAAVATTRPSCERLRERRRDHPRQDGDDRARRLHARQDAQPARSRRARPAARPPARPRRSAPAMVPLAVGIADQRLGHPPGLLLRRRRLQAEPRADLAARHAGAVGDARHGRASSPARSRMRR